MKDIDNPELCISQKESLLDYKEYFILKENNIYKIYVIKNRNNITIKIKNYQKVFKLNEISKFTKVQLKSIDKAFTFFNNIFDQNKVIIKNEIFSNKIFLEMIIDANSKIELDLIYNEKSENFIMEKIKNLENNINILKQENLKLINEIKELKKYHDKNNPKDINFLKDLSKSPNAYINLDNSFAVFKSINNLLFLIHPNIIQSIICYDLNNFKIINEIKNAHNKHISNLKHYFDRKNKRDLIMSISCDDNNIKIWDFKNWECIFDIIKINNAGDLYVGCILEEKGQNLILSSNRNKDGDSENIKIFNFNGQKVGELKDSNENTLFLDSYYDNKLSINFIITGNFGHIKAYDFEKKELYKIYYDNNNRGHYCAIINNYENIIQLIESSTDGKIRIWNFHSGLLLKVLDISDKGLRGICLWDDNYIFVGCDDKTIKLVDINNETVVKTLFGHENKIITLRKINHPKLGKCLISQAFQRDKIKIWKNKNLLI